jgi:hypothetical protein
MLCRTATMKLALVPMSPVPWRSLCYSIPRVLSEIGRPKAQYNMVSGDPGVNQLRSAAVFGIIPLNPHLVVDNVDVDNAPMDAAGTVPPYGEHERVVCLAVKTTAVCISPWA